MSDLGFRISDFGFGPAASARRPVSAHHSSLITHHSSLSIRRRAFTLVEIMVVFAVIAILAVIVTWASRAYIRDAKVKQTRAVMSTINLAIAEYMQLGKGAPPQPDDVDDNTPPFTTRLPPGSDKFRMDFFRERSGTPDDFTTEGSGDPPAEGKDDPPNHPGAVAYSVTPKPSINARFDPDHKRIYGIQALYFYLVREPNTKNILNKLPASNLARPDKIPAEMGFQNAGTWMATGETSSGRVPWNTNDTTLSSRVTEVLVILDAWGRPMHYLKNPAENNYRPGVQSAGPDGVFGNEDDVYSFGGK